MTPEPRELDRLLQNVLALHEEILLSDREEVPEESLGFVYGRNRGEQRLRTVLGRIPRGAGAIDEAAYIIRAIVCSQVFNEGDKRLATTLANLWFQGHGLRLIAAPENLKRFMYRIVGKCPGIPLPPARLQDKDDVYNFIRTWLEDNVGKVK